MRSRIEQGYRLKFHSLLARVRPRRLEFGVELLMRRARELSRSEGLPLPQALARTYESTRLRVERRVALMAACTVAPATAPSPGPPEPPRFVCDASLGGLARWLRAAGYEARWLRAGRAEAALREADESGAILLTSDSRLLERKRIKDGSVRSLWVPSALTRMQQLALVLRELGLPPREARCMSCGGELRRVEKEAVRERIPPRTARWKDEYFLCSACGRLYWQGTHWERIVRRLAESAPG